MLPAFLLGGLAVLVRADLEFSETQLGFAVSTFFAASAVSAVAGGNISERLGAHKAMSLAAAGSGGALVGIAALARSYWMLLVFLAAAGLANSMAQPATNLALARAIPTHRHGLAFGIKQTNGPAATFLAGLALPYIGLPLGWRWAFVASALVSGLFFLLLPSARAVSGQPLAPESGATSTGASTPRPDVSRNTLLLLAAGAACGNAAAAALVAFYVESAVEQGAAAASAGLLFAFGSVIGTAARVLWGWMADRKAGNPLRRVALLLAVGAVGFAALPLANVPGALVLGTVGAFGAGWAWLGLYLLAVVRASPSAPAAATGFVIMGIGVGGILGPPAFGWLVESTSYTVAWSAAAGQLLAAAGLVIGADWLLRRQPAPPPS